MHYLLLKGSNKFLEVVKIYLKNNICIDICRDRDLQNRLNDFAENKKFEELNKIFNERVNNELDTDKVVLEGNRIKAYYNSIINSL